MILLSYNQNEVMNMNSDYCWYLILKAIKENKVHNKKPKSNLVAFYVFSIAILILIIIRIYNAG